MIVDIRGLLFLSHLIFIISNAVAQDRALFFAVDEYENKDLKALKHPIDDAKDIADKLSSIYGFETEVIENPTLEEMAQTINDLQAYYQKQEMDQTGRLLLFFSGHGTVDNRNGYFLPKDANPNSLFNTSFAYSIWRPFIDNINCKHILVAIDACFSGTFDPSWWEGKKNDPFKRPGELGEGALLIANHEKHITRYFFTSATEKETPDKSKFAKKFKEAMISKGGKDGILTSTELFTFLEVASPIPHRGEFGKDEPESSFLFLVTDRSNVGQLSTISKEEQKVWDDALAENTINGYQAYINAYPAGNYVMVAQNIIAKIEDWTAPTQRYTYVVDKDRNAYAVLRMKDGKQWMTQNLNVKMPKSYCYDDLPTNCEKYGRLYKWEAAIKGCESLGGGWRLPKDEEWKNLRESYGGEVASYTSLLNNGGSGFSAQLGGWRSSNGNYCLDLGRLGSYWSSSWSDDDYASSLSFSSSSGELYYYSSYKTHARSVRCIKD